MRICPKCKAELPDGAVECSHCGVVISKYMEAKKRAIARKKAELQARQAAEAEAKQQAEAQALAKEKRAASRQAAKPKKLMLDCPACKGTQTMGATRVPRFPSLIRLIGYIIALPSALGVVVAGVLFVGAMRVAAEQSTRAMSEAAATGVAVGTGISVTVAIIIAAVSLVGGLVGWLLIMKKNVFKCQVCGFIMDRA